MNGLRNNLANRAQFRLGNRNTRRQPGHRTRAMAARLIAAGSVATTVGVADQAHGDIGSDKEQETQPETPGDRRTLTESVAHNNGLIRSSA